MGSLNIAKCLNSSSNYSESMTAALFLCLLAFQQASLAPQYADQTNQELFGNQLDVFGDSQVEEAHSAHTVKNEAGYTAPHDYQEASIGKLNNVATGVKAQNTLNHYSQCSISWTLSNFGRETDSLTSSGGYSDPHPGPPGGRTPPVTPSPLSDGS